MVSRKVNGMFPKQRILKLETCSTCRVYKPPKELSPPISRYCSLCRMHIYKSCKQCVKTYKYVQGEYEVEFYICNPCQRSPAYTKPCGICGENKRPYDVCKYCKLPICKPCQVIKPPPCKVCKTVSSCVGCASIHLKPCRSTIIVPNRDGIFNPDQFPYLLTVPFPTIVEASLVSAANISSIVCPDISCVAYPARNCSTCNRSSRHNKVSLSTGKNVCCCCYYVELREIWAFRLTEINMPPVLLKIINDYGQFIA